jgi:hypothetical protein
MRNASQTGRWAAGALLLLACWTRAAQANSGDVFFAPRPGVKPASGLTMVVDTTWASSVGYRPVRVAVSPLPAGPAAADRVLRVELSTKQNYFRFERNLTVGQTLELPQGATSAETVIAVPQSMPWRELRIDVFEDGERLDDLSFTANISMAGAIYGDDGAPAILIVDSDAPPSALRSQVPTGTNVLPDFRVLASLHPMGAKPAPMTTAAGVTVMGMAATPGAPTIITDVPVPTPAPAPAPTPTAATGIFAADDRTLLLELPDCPGLDLLPPASLPERWIDYSGIDVVILSFSDLTLLRDKHAAKWRAMRDWLGAGGVLCVYDVGGERLDQLSRMLDLPPKPAEGDPAGGWTAPGFQPYDETYHFFATNEELYAYDAQGNPVTPDPIPMKEVTGMRFLTRRVEFGTVAAIANENAFPGVSGEWGQLYNALGQSRWTWYQRHGVSLTSENRDYWDLLIPGVGLPPVNAFRVLITLFAVLVGPVNYMVLKKKKRLNYLLVTVPAGAALVTLGLVFYALISDGLGVRSRVRSFTELDQKNDRAASWSRQSYYASLTPSRGMVFPADAAVYPIEPDGEEARGQSERIMEWSGDKQQLARGYLGPRTLAQFLVVRSTHDAKSELVISKANGASGELEVENRLGGRIEKLWLVDSGGKSYWGEAIGQARSKALAAKDPADCLGLIQEALSANAPRTPEGFDPNMRRRRGFGYYYGYSYRNNSLPPASQTGSLFERKMSQLSSPAFKLAPKSYIAIVERSAETPTGVESAKEEASFHVIYGKW